jgi:acetyl-CoA carboxylase biotin carboxylase subunit
VLVANRGEIAVRVIRALRESGILSVAVYSDADRGSLAVRLADEAAHIGPSPSAESYLRIERILEAAAKHGAEAVHPGYGFLSENGGFAQACRDSGLVFIGPSPEAIKKMGSKTEARKLALSTGVPVAAGSQAAVRDLEEAGAAAGQAGYPVLLKAAAGGGGKGMRRVDRPEDLETALRDASSEALRAFGDGSMYVEKWIENPRHIEIQILGDMEGNLIHLGERECSIQRRHQKVIEECPSPVMSTRPELRNEMGDAAIRVARAAGYWNAGTVEFLVDSRGRYYFLEMNTRLQVEHPVTELVTGFDLVLAQLKIAAGEPLPWRQDEVRWRGSAIECRIYAEDPDNDFFPSPGRISRWDVPAGPGVRLDAGVYPGWTVPMDYDPLLAKLAVWGDDRETARRRMARALREFFVGGIRTNLAWFRDVLEDEAFIAGRLNTGFVKEFAARRPEGRGDPEVEAAAILAACMTSSGSDSQDQPRAASSRWRDCGRSEAMR